MSVLYLSIRKQLIVLDDYSVIVFAWNVILAYEINNTVQLKSFWLVNTQYLSMWSCASHNSGKQLACKYKLHVK
jgi:hypothetical protein